MALLSTFFANVSGAMALEGNDPSQGNDFVITSQGASERDLRVKGGGVESVSGSSGAVFSLDRIQALLQREKERADSNSRLISFLEQLRDIQQQIEDLERLIEQYDTQIEAIDELITFVDEHPDLVNPDGTINTDNDRIKDLLTKAGIPPEQWKDLTVEDLERIKEDREEARKAAKDAKNKAEDQYDNAISGSPQEVEQAKNEFFEARNELDQKVSDWLELTETTHSANRIDGSPEYWEAIRKEIADLTLDEKESVLRVSSDPELNSIVLAAIQDASPGQEQATEAMMEFL